MRWGVGVIIGMAGLSSVHLWNYTPPAPDDPDVVQLTGACCLGPGVPWLNVRTERGAGPAAQVVLYELGGPNRISGGAVDLSYDLFVWPEDEAGQHTETALTDSDLAVGDTVSHGPATIEVVKIHDAIWDRYDAVDLRVTFDLDRIDEVP